ncbi:MAG: helix-turn-helix domain containing protein [Nitrospira sp.]|nr:helix-turn-helix domain containing protein [Nitrospira sp.]MDH5251866.1 helix-turn-helix domain containing protein [Nitrospira sp.]
MSSAIQSVPRPRARKFDHSLALDLALKGLPYQDIANKFGVHVTSVKQALSKFQHILNDLQPGAVEAYRHRRTELFTMAEREMIASMVDPAKIAKASLNNIAYAFQQIHTARRLEEGKSTENKSVITAMIDAAHSSLYSASPKAKHVDKPQPIDSNVPDIMDREISS